MRKIKIGYYPFTTKDNPYVERTKEILGNFCEVRETPSIRKAILNPWIMLRHRNDATILNWTDNHIVSRNGKISLLGIVSLLVYLALIKASSKKILFVRHNNYPHHCIPGTGKIASRIIDRLERFFDRAITHSGHNQSAHRVYIPHPLYKEETTSQETPGDHYLIFGRILPYKKIEQLIANIPATISVIVAGSAPDKDYLENLYSCAEGKNITFIPRYIPAKEAEHIAKTSRGILITNNDADMVVSGSYFYAFSLGIPIYTVSTPFAEWASEELKISDLNIFKTVNELCLQLSDSSPLKGISNIKEVSHSLFNDKVIEDRWKKLLLQD